MMNSFASPAICSPVRVMICKNGTWTEAGILESLPLWLQEPFRRSDPYRRDEEAAILRAEWRSFIERALDVAPYPPADQPAPRLLDRISRPWRQIRAFALKIPAPG